MQLMVSLLKKGAKSTIILTAMISVWSIALAVEHTVRNIRIRLLTALDIGEIIIKWKQEKLRMVICKNI